MIQYDMTKKIQVPRAGSMGKVCYQSSGHEPAYAHMCVHIHINILKKFNRKEYGRLWCLETEYY